MALDVDDELEEENQPPPKLEAAAEELLTLVTETRDLRGNMSDTDRLLDVLGLLGRLHARCVSETGFFSSFDPPPADDEERAWVAERELAFVRRCADALADVATSCVRFAIALWVNLRPDWEEVAEARRKTVGEAREELLGELGILGERTGRKRQLAPNKHDVAEFLSPMLHIAALTCADAVHELADAQLPGTAGVTMLGLAASLLTDGDEIATAASYASWPALEDDDW